MFTKEYFQYVILILNTYHRQLSNCYHFSDMWNEYVYN